MTLEDMLRELTNLRPLRSSELEAADIVSNTVSLFKSISTASPAGMNQATVTMLSMMQELEEDAREDDLDEEGLRLLKVMISMAKTTLDHMKATIAAHVGLDCDGDCHECKTKPKTEEKGECYSPALKSIWKG
jgi:hypothetical protein